MANVTSTFLKQRPERAGLELFVAVRRKWFRGRKNDGKEDGVSG